MKCEVDTGALIACGAYQGVITAAMAITGGIAAPFALTAVTVGSVAMTVGLFAAPALLVGVGMTALFTLLPDLNKLIDFNRKSDTTHVVFWIQAATFALLSAATITAGVLLGALTMPLMITFIVASVIVTLAIATLNMAARFAFLQLDE